jgi:hypothetical protein
VAIIDSHFDDSVLQLEGSDRPGSLDIFNFYQEFAAGRHRLSLCLDGSLGVLCSDPESHADNRGCDGRYRHCPEGNSNWGDRQSASLHTRPMPGPSRSCIRTPGSDAPRDANEPPNLAGCDPQQPERLTPRQSHGTSDLIWACEPVLADALLKTITIVESRAGGWLRGDTSVVATEPK